MILKTLKKHNLHPRLGVLLGLKKIKNLIKLLRNRRNLPIKLNGMHSMPIKLMKTSSKISKKHRRINPNGMPFKRKRQKRMALLNLKEPKTKRQKVMDLKNLKNTLIHNLKQSKPKHLNQ